MSLEKKTVLITGASSGIGEACARLFAKAGHDVSLAARRLERLEKLAQELRSGGVKVLVREVDVTQPEQVDGWVQATLTELGSMDVLVNNAGAGCVGRVADLDLKYLRQVMEINYFGAITCIQAVVPQMRKQRCGQIINISSIIGKRAVPDIGGYCASKFALQAATDALRLELKDKGIVVTTVCPGLTTTEFVEKQIRPERTPPLRTHMKGHTPEQVARAIVKATHTHAREVHLTASGRLLLTLERLSPSLVDYLLGFRGGLVSQKD